MEDEEIAAEDEEDMGIIETYSNYMPTKLKVYLSLSQTIHLGRYCSEIPPTADRVNSHLQCSPFSYM